MKKRMGGTPLLPMNIIILSALLIGGCRGNDPVAKPALNTDYSIIDGDTIKTVVFKDYKILKDKDPNGKNYITVGDTIVLYKEPKLHTPPSKDPDLSKLKNNDDPDLKGKPLRYVAIGGSLTAGVRDGGYFNEGILTSYPNLIARQMKLKKFEQPLFDATDYNGFGRKVQTGFNPTGGKVPKLNAISNNLSITISGTDFNFKKVKTVVDNFAIPNGRYHSQGVEGAFYRDLKYQNGILKKYSERFLTNGAGSELLNQKFDIMTFEFGINDVLDYILKGTDYMRSSGLENSYLESDLWFDLLSKKKTLGIILNVPDVLDFPYFTQISYDDVFGGIPNDYIESDAGRIFKDKRKNSTDIIFLPNSRVDSLSSVKVHPALKVGLDNKSLLLGNNFLIKQEIADIRNAPIKLNAELERYSKKVNFRMVDLYSMYKKINDGSFVTDDGVRVNSKNFFSIDGINPTAFGQAVVANEVIKTLNQNYKSEIPLIKTSEYLEVK
ncbi:SGNH/GDSL hydrolase family protein [Emticicia aquatilis]|nr:SGNH/GDSL hydrolase family protein [Emticicia aquatilis]